MSTFGDFTAADLWPIGSVVLVAFIFVFLGLELLAHWMSPRPEDAENDAAPEFWRDAFSRRSAYTLVVMLLLFAVVMGLAVCLGF